MFIELICSSIAVVPIFLLNSMIISLILIFNTQSKYLECANYIYTILIQILMNVIILFDSSNTYPLYILLYYFLWDLIYINLIETKLYSYQLVLHHIISIIIIIWSLNTFNSNQYFMNLCIVYLERANILSNLSFLLQKLDNYNLSKIQLLNLNILYFGSFIYDRIFRFIPHIFQSIILSPEYSLNTKCFTICLLCILIFISIKIIIKQYMYIKKIRLT